MVFDGYQPSELELCEKYGFLNWKETIHQLEDLIKTKNCEGYLFIQLDAISYVLYNVLSVLTRSTNLVIIIDDYGSLYHYFHFIHKKSEVRWVKQSF